MTTTTTKTNHRAAVDDEQHSTADFLGQLEFLLTSMSLKLMSSVMSDRTVLFSVI